jgi:alpha-galactosidase
VGQTLIYPRLLASQHQFCLFFPEIVIRLDTEGPAQIVPVDSETFMKQTTAAKVAVIGAGSVVFTRHLIRDILSVPPLANTQFALHDINPRNLEMALLLAQKDIDANCLPAKVTASVDRRETLQDADYIINFTRIGGLEAFALDIDIPLKYGVDQCVGDTLCAGGIMYGQRNIPCILKFCRDIRDVSKPSAIFMNYANPMCINTWAALDYGSGVKTIGFCHGIEHGWDQIAEVLGGKYPTTVDGICTGINHQTWYTKILHNGREVSAEQLLAAFERHTKFSKTERCRIDVLRRFGYYSTESNGHLSEYLPWYRKRVDQIHRYIDTSLWIFGETGGYLRVCIEGRNWFETDFPRWLKAEDPPITAATRSSERASYVIEALETGKRYRTYMNLRNNGCITNLADDAVIETPVYVDQCGIQVPRVGDLPLACAATCSASINVQRMAKEAGVRGDVTLLKQAMLHDPLVGAVCNPEEVWQMTDEMLVAQAQWLPQYAREIPAARQRLANHEKRGTRIRPIATRGAVRKEIKTVEQIRQDSSELAWLGATDAKTID